MSTNQSIIQEKKQNFNETQQSIYERLSQADQQKLTSEIVTYLMSPLRDKRISKIAQKFKQIQLSIIQVIEYRVKLQNQLVVNKLQQSHFNIVCQLYDKIKQRDLVINQLGKRYSQLDTKYLLKVAQVEQEKYYRQKLKQQNQRLKNLHNGKINKSLDEQNQIAQIQMEIISLKNVMRTFLSSAHASPLGDEGQDHTHDDLYGIKNFSLQSKQTSNRNNHLSELQKQLKTLKSNLTMRLQMIEQSDEISQKYESTQQQLINRLMEELMRLKTYQSSKSRVSIKGHDNMKDDSQQIHQEYERSQNNLNDLLEAELVEMKQKLQKTQQEKTIQSQVFINLNKRISQLQNQLKQKDQQLKLLEKKITSQKNQNQRLMKQFQEHKNQQKKRQKQIQLVYETKIQQLQLENINQTQRTNIELKLAMQKVQKLQTQIQILNHELKKAKLQATQINKNKNQKIQQQIEEINETNRSLQNEKVLLKTLNKKLNKQLNDAQKKCIKMNDQNLGLKNKIKQLEQKIQDSQQIISSLKLQLELKHDKIKQITQKLYQSQKIIKEERQRNAQDEKNMFLLKDQITRLNKKNQQDQQKLKRLEQQLKQKNETIVSNQASNVNEHQMADKQKILRQKQQKIQKIQKDLITKIQLLEQKQSQLIQNQKELKDTQNLLLKKEKELQQIWVSYEKKNFQIKKLQQTLNNLSEFLRQKQTDLQRKQSQINQKKIEVQEKEKQLEKMKSDIQREISQRQKIEAQECLSPPPSPIQLPQQSPPISPSPFKLQSSQPMIPIDDDSVKIKLKFIDMVKPQDKIAQKQITNRQIDMQRINQTCQQLADNWMKSQQQKWNSLHFEIDSIYRMLVQSQF